MPNYPRSPMPFRGPPVPRAVRASFPDLPPQSAATPPLSSPIVPMSPEGVTVACGFTLIDTPNPALSTAAANLFGLGSWSYDDIGQDFALTALHWRMLSPNASGADVYNTGGACKWGQIEGAAAVFYDFGHLCGIAIGKNLPVALNQWARGVPFDVNGPGRSAGDTLTKSARRIIHVEPFPPGDLANVNTIRDVRGTKSLSPDVRRFSASDRLDVALVIGPEAAARLNSSIAPIQGFASVMLDIRPIVPETPQAL